MKKSARLTRKQLPFLPIGNQLMLKSIETKGETAGGIVLPERMRHPVNQGIIVAVGDDVPFVKSEDGNFPFALGNVVVFPLYSDSTIEVDDVDPKHPDRTIAVKYIVVPYDQVICSDFGYFASLQKNEN